LKSQQKESLPGNGLAAEISEGSTNSENLENRVSRYGKAKARSVQMQAFIQGSDQYHDEYLKLKECGNFLLFHNYYTVGKTLLHHACFCKKHLLCPLCAIRRGSKFVGAYSDRVKALKLAHGPLNASMVTLTVKNGNLLNERFNHIVNSYRKLEQSRRDSKRNGYESEWGKVLGLVGTYEITKKEKGWHPHIHMFVFHTEKIYQGALAKQWKKITGDSNIVDVTPVHHPDEPELDFLEVFKYSLKFHELSLEDNLKAYDFLSNKRLVFSAGIMRGVKVPDSLLDDPINPAELPYIEILYNYYQGKGYVLKEKFKIPF